MKQIPLTQGKIALVDAGDYEWLMSWKWHLIRNDDHLYAARYESPLNKNAKMHRIITNAPDGAEVDHINGNGLDNRRENLRVCLKSENQWNREKTRRNKSGYKGVYWHKPRRKYRAQITVNGKQMNLGAFDNPEAAARAYDEAAKRYHGKFARLNFEN